MGVRGLQTFLKNNKGLSKQVNLHDTCIVIDANNLLCILYCNLCNGNRHLPNYRNDIYGGDMVSYAELIRKFFTTLDKCNITPILVFDGSVIGKQSTRNELVLKDREVFKRCYEKFLVSKAILEEAPNEQIIMPQTIHHVFKVVVCELGIQMIQTPYEADTHIARVANDMNCPVLTNDSDFMIYPLKEGFILFDLFNYTQPVALGDKFAISCSIYSANLLLKYFPGFYLPNLPLVSILLGNDYVEAGTFDRVLGPICDRHYSGSLKAETRNHRKIANLLEWLKIRNSLDEAINMILDQVHQSNRDRLRHTIKILCRNYKVECADNFEDELNEVYKPGESINHNQTPASYLRRLFEHTDLSPICLDIVFHNTHYNYSSIDDNALPSSSYVKYRPFALMLSLLRPISYQGLNTYRREIQREKDTFYMFDRVKDDYKKLKIIPMEELESFGSLELSNCQSTITLEPALKKSILQSAFRFDNEHSTLMTETVSCIFSETFVQESTICFMLIKYIGLETKSSPKAEFVDAVALTIFYYAAISGQLNKELSKRKVVIGKFLLDLRPHSFKNNGKTYSPSQSLFRRIVHFISQLQAAYASYSLLNAILGHVYEKPRYDKFLNGTLIFRLTKLLRLGQLKLKDLCTEMEPLSDALTTIKTIVLCE